MNPTSIYIAVDHFSTPTLKQVTPQRLPNTQPLSRPQVLLLFLSTHCNASLPIQDNNMLIRAVFFLAIAVF